MPEQFDVPILFIIFNRPDTTLAVFNEIKKLQPKQLYVVADGPRADRPDEHSRCNAARAIIDGVDWNCEVFKNFSDTNLGCKKRVSSGLDWFFQNVAEGIVLEDDCLPDQSFFHYCRDLLSRYRDNQQIMMISGNNFQFGKKRGEASYYFSKYCHIWGWASWRRAWQSYDVDMKSYPEFKQQDQIRNIWRKPSTQRHWLNIFDKVHANKIDTWDYQWTYSILSHNGLAIIPNINLISNIGFGNDSTHTKTYNRFANMATAEMSELSHPQFILQDVAADEYFSRNLRLLNRVINKIKFLH